MQPFELRFRQVHLDFHTSEAIEGIGSAFDPEEFAATLERARVDSVTCFARCHHGWIYFDTEAFPERRHPHLKRNLLAEQIEACHKRGIRVPIYISVQWDHYTAVRHPEWLCVDEYGRPQGPSGQGAASLFKPGFYRNLCLNSPYVDFLKEHTREVLEKLPVDGIFFDIVQPQLCACRYCRQGMQEDGLDPADPDARERFGLRVINDFKRDMTAFVRSFSPDCSIFYNAGHVGPRHREVAAAYTHFEIESLPSGGWGYLHFPIVQRYARGLGIDTLGMTGKFHTSWGDFHSFKNEAALQFECFQMLALGAKCSVGDQLHPTGAIDPDVYELIGSVYREVEKKEPYCRGARPVTEIGVLTSEEFSDGKVRVSPSMAGVTRMLQEGGHQFDILDSRSDLSPYAVLVLPDAIPVSPALAAKLRRYLAGGGALIASYRSGLNETGERFALEELGVRLVGEAPYSPDFLVPKERIGRGLPRTEHVMYQRGLQVEAVGESEVLADVAAPYFNRTWEHFCSHAHTPSRGETAYPGIVRKGRAIYFAHPLFAQYDQNAPRWCKRLFLNALDLLLPEPILRLKAPSSTIATVNEQPDHGRRIVHLLHYIPERRGRDFDVIEDVIPLYDVEVSVKMPRPVKAVRLVPEDKPLDFNEKGGRVAFRVPKLLGHAMIALETGETDL